MKTILEIAQECGAYKFRNFGDIIDKVCFTEAQLTATIDLWNRQNSELVYQVLHSRRHDWEEVTKLEYEKYGCKGEEGVKRIVYLAPPQTQSVREALEMAAKICDEYTNIEVDNDFNCGVRNVAVKIWTDIRDLIDQPQPPASQELIDRISKLEKLSVTNIMIDVVPGDGSGYEVYAKSVGDVEKLLGEMSLELDALKFNNYDKELLDYVDRLEATVKVIADTTSEKTTKSVCEKTLQSKPAKG